MIMEAIACGIPDMMEHNKRVILARPYEPEDLAEWMLWVMADREIKHGLSRSSCQKKIAYDFSEKRIAQRYASVFEEILIDRKARLS